MTDVLDATRCPQCDSIVRPGQDWCTLCHADLRPAPPPAPEPPAPVTPVAAAPDPLSDPLPAEPAPTPGRHARRAPEDIVIAPELSTAAPAEAGSPPALRQGGPSDADIDAMLARLAIESGNPLGEVSGRLGSRSAKAALAIGLCLGLMVLIFVGSVVLTSVFG